MLFYGKGKNTQDSREDAGRVVSALLLGVIGIIVAFFNPFIGVLSSVFGIYFSARTLDSEFPIYSRIGLLLSVAGIIASFLSWIYLFPQTVN